MKKARKGSLSLHGKFSLPGNRTVFGELKIDGSDSLLLVKDASAMDLGYERRHIRGISVDNDHITCVDCIHSAHGINTQGKLNTHYWELFPHYVVVGMVHLDPDAKSITSISFATDDLDTLFFDRDAFGVIPNASSIIDSVLTDRQKNRKIEVGEHPQVHYYTDRGVALDVESVIGHLSVSFELRSRLDGVHGNQLTGHRRFQIAPEDPINFEEAIDRIGVIRRFLSLAAGRPQSITAVRIVTKDEITRISPLYVHWTYAPKGPRGDVHVPLSFNLPFDPVERPDEFKRVLQNWIAKEPGMLIPRARLLMGLRKANSYDPDRLIAAANMFDLLPPDACPKDVPLPPEMAAFKKEARAKLKAKNFPNSDAKLRALGDMGRWGKASLTDKVLHRWAVASKDISDLFEDMDYVLRLAVKCRNHFVHGPNAGFKYDRAEPFLSLFTDSLEFVFAFADLVEAGWKPAEWRGRPYADGHMFGRFRMMYYENAARLKVAMEIDSVDEECINE